ncbi:hypothetical protein MTO96_043910 [Rhipicephalus appendiculatus]
MAVVPWRTATLRKRLQLRPPLLARRLRTRLDLVRPSVEDTDTEALPGNQSPLASREYNQRRRPRAGSQLSS